MFDTRTPGCGSGSGSTIPAADDIAPDSSAVLGAADPASRAAVPLERLEAQICELAGHLTAATCRFLILLGDFDARRGWASWDMPSCAAWLSWKCQMSSGTAREHVRVARSLRNLPVIRGQFAAGRLSYAKVRALTRIATPETDKGLAEIAGPMTGNQLERFARAHRQVSQADDATARIRRRLTWRTEEDGSLAGTFRLPPLQGAVLLKALRAAAGDLVHPHDDEEPDVSAETPADGSPRLETSSSLADALLVIAEAFLAGKVAAAEDPDVYQVIVHVGTDTMTPTGRIPVSTSPAAAATSPAAAASGPTAASPAPATTEPTPAATTDPTPAATTDRTLAATASPVGVSAETSTPPSLALGHPADPARCHVEDGPAISVGTAQVLACTAALSWMLHDSAGKLLDLGRRRRRPNATLRRAARERDHCRCRFPGCESRRVDLHHIQYWSHGGKTKLDNIISLCKYHHMLVHDRGCLIAARPDGTFAFYHSDGAAIPPSPALPEADGMIEGCHDADITPDTIVPPWYGERLDLDHAIYVCLANAANQARRPEQPEVRYDPEEEYEPFQPRMGVSNPVDWIVEQGREHAVA